VSRHAFADCRHIVDVVLPDSIGDIGDQSFMNCRSLRSIVLPVGTRYLWSYAFRGCSSLRRIEVRSPEPPDSYNDVFDSHTLRFATLVVSAAHRNIYIWHLPLRKVPLFGWKSGTLTIEKRYFSTRKAVVIFFEKV